MRHGEPHKPKELPNDESEKQNIGFLTKEGKEHAKASVLAVVNEIVKGIDPKRHI